MDDSQAGGAADDQEEASEPVRDAPEHQQVPYAEDNDAALNDAFDESFELGRDAEGDYADFVCPRCFGAQRARIDRTGRQYRLNETLTDADESSRVTLTVQCECGKPHEDQPEGQAGCGYFADVVVTR